MRSNKEYSNVPFTKRVDYAGGAHRPPRAARGAIACRDCGAVYVKRRWVLPTEPAAIAVAALARPGRCPSCTIKARKQVRGYVYAEGAFARVHRPEIEALLRQEAARAAVDNPLGQLIAWERTPERLTVSTTTEHLAQRLGEALHSAYHGKVRYKFSHGEPFARVTWRRD